MSVFFSGKRSGLLGGLWLRIAGGQMTYKLLGNGLDLGKVETLLAHLGQQQSCPISTEIQGGWQKLSTAGAAKGTVG